MTAIALAAALALLGAAPEKPPVRAASVKPAAAPAPAAAAPAARADLRAPPPPALHAGETRCERCHTTEQWGDVAFAHERTGFPLKGEHLKVGCKQCHAGDFKRPLSHECSACHRDPHRGQLGARCQGCHDEASWKSRFDADAHRRSGFPLVGRHAFVACDECHGDKLNRGFARGGRPCYDCHQKDLARGTAVIDHGGFGTQCKECHSPWRFKNAFFPAHEACFSIAGGPHAGIACRSCHTSGLPPTGVAACTSGTANCIACHKCAEHPAQAGFACQNLKCYQCHRFSTRSGALRGARSLTP